MGFARSCLALVSQGKREEMNGKIVQSNVWLAGAPMRVLSRSELTTFHADGCEKTRDHVQTGETAHQ